MKNIAIFASGSGSNFEAIVKACLDGSVKANPAVCICDRPGAGVVERAVRLGVPCLEFKPRDFKDKEAYETAVLAELRKRDVQLVCLAGYMRIVGRVLLEAFPNRIINIHPSLLPAFKGAHAIRDAFEYGVKVYGVTIHFVDESLDGGKIIAQTAVPYEGTDIEELEAKIHKAEHKLYPEVITKLLPLIK